MARPESDKSPGGKSRRFQPAALEEAGRTGQRRAGMARWQELISRSLAQVAMDAFPSVADAISELVDNPVDFRRGRRIEISVQVDRPHDTIVVEDHGGAGMDAAGIADWLNWGSGRARRPTDIGQYRQGGKAACGYLADSLVLWAKAAGTNDVWLFEDNDWRKRAEPRDWGEPEPVPSSMPLPRSLQGRPKDDGYVRLELSRLRPQRYNLEELRWRLSSTYRRLLQEDAISIALNGEPVEPLALPLSSARPSQPLDLRTPSGRRVRGWAAKLDRDAVTGVSAKHRIPGGMRCLYQGRLIRAGEYFGHHSEGKGSLASLIGEVELGFIGVIPQKTDFHRDSPEWQEVEKAMQEALVPIVAELRKGADKPPVSREERKTLAQVCEELGEAFRKLRVERLWSGDQVLASPPEPGAARVDPPVIGVGGRKRPVQQKEKGGPQPRESGQHHRQPPQPRTVPPPDAVGHMLRLLDRVTAGTLRPPVVFDSIDSHVRSAWRWDNGSSKIVVNTDFCLCRELGASPGYLAETIILELAKPPEGEDRSLGDYLSEVTNVLIAWSSVHDE